MAVNVDELVLLAEQALTTPSIDAPAALEVLVDALLVAGIGRKVRPISRRKQRHAAHAWASAAFNENYQDPVFNLALMRTWRRAQLFDPVWIRERVRAAEKACGIEEGAWPNERALIKAQRRAYARALVLGFQTREQVGNEPLTDE